jgi:cell pole-organizing protein PopZ
MTGNKPDQEPSIEEILASIRQIISDDDEPQRTPGEIELPKEEKFEIPVHVPAPEPVQAPRESFADVLELTNEIKNDRDVVLDYGSDDDSYTIPVADPVPEPPARAAAVDLSAPPEPPARKAEVDLSSSQNDIDSLFSAPAAAATTEAFSRLVGNIPVERAENKTLYADGRITLEDITKDLLRPMLRQWIEENVPRMVERLVEKELEKLARQARDD